MKQTETARFLAVVKTAYPHFEISNEVARLWHEFLEEIDYQTAQANLREHIKSSRFPPTIADIVRNDPQQFVDHEQLKLETESRLAEMEEWQQQAIDCPAHRIPKLLKGGPVGD